MLKFLFTLFLLTHNILGFSQLIGLSKDSISPSTLKTVKQNGIIFLSDNKINSCKIEKKSNKSIEQLSKKYGNLWRDTLVSLLHEDKYKINKYINKTANLSSLHSNDYKKRKSVHLYFNKKGYIIKKEAVVKSKKKKYIEKTWCFSDEGVFLNKVRVVKIK